VTVDDPVLDGMAKELHDVLKQKGLDPKHPPQESDPPSATFFAEYRRRGGSLYEDPNEAVTALIERVKTL
jgi:hypothetical protein